MGAWRVDISQAFRPIGRRRAFSAFAILILAGGIGAATAVFTLVHAVLLHALPFAEPDRLVWMYNARTERDRAPFSIPDLDDYARDARTLAGFATFGGVLGVAFAAEPIALWRAFGPVNSPRVADVAVNGRVISFAAAATLAATLVAGVLPAWLATQDLHGALGGETRALTGSRRQEGARRAGHTDPVALFRT